MHPQKTYCDVPGTPCLSKKRIKCTVRPPVNGPKDPLPCVLSLPGAQGGFVGDPTSLARDNIYNLDHLILATCMSCIFI